MKNLMLLTNEEKFLFEQRRIEYYNHEIEKLYREIEHYNLEIERYRVKLSESKVMLDDLKKELKGGNKMVKVDFGFHYSDSYESEEIALEEMAEFIEQEYEFLVLEEGFTDKATIREMFDALGWEFVEIK